MSLPPGNDPQKPKITSTRIVIWLVVGGIALYLIISGIAGIIAKG